MGRIALASGLGVLGCFLLDEYGNILGFFTVTFFVSLFWFLFRTVYRMDDSQLDQLKETLVAVAQSPLGQQLAQPHTDFQRVETVKDLTIEQQRLETERLKAEVALLQAQVREAEADALAAETEAKKKNEESHSRTRRIIKKDPE